MHDRLTGRRRSRRRGAWLLLAASLVLLVLAVAGPWAGSVGSSRSSVCRDGDQPLAVVSADSPEVWISEARQSWLPLGVTCRWINTADGRVIVVKPGAGATALAAVGLLGVASSLAQMGGRGRQDGSMHPPLHDR